ncbi:MAG: glycosyl transferase [Spirochaetales bacterium]|nr:glycosyl transferase [Spirochaetales bacterium]
MYGHFDHGNREYVITNPKPPAKWINYIGTLAFGGFVDHNGSGVICKGDPALNRIVKYIPQLPLSDMNGETLYVRLKNKNGGYTLYSPFYTPCLQKPKLYECRVGLGYNRYVCEYRGVRTVITVFVPAGGTQVLRLISVENTGKTPQEIDLIPVAEYTHFDALKQFTNADWVPQTMQSKAFKRKDGRVILRQCAFMRLGKRENFFTANLPASSFETNRAVFLGDNGYGGWAAPHSLNAKELSDSEALRGDNIAALMLHLGTLVPGQKKTLVTQLGQLDAVSATDERITKYYNEKECLNAFDELAAFWRGYLSALQVDTPDEAMNAMLNVHNARQCYITKNWSRYLSLYQLGLGARGMGFRDSSQDVMGILANAPEEGRELIEKLLSVQKRDGSAMHQFNPLTMIANEGDSREDEDRPKYYGDDHLWIILASCAYIKETGNLKFLDKQIPFYDKDKNGRTIEKGSVSEHLRRGIHFTHDHTGKHGLPLLGFADWNDTINLPTGAESVFVANQYCLAARELADVLEFSGDKKTAAGLKTWYDEMKDTINRKAWDGAWYRRYYDHKGKPIGAASCQYGRVFANAQSWAVMSGVAEGERMISALNTIRKNLNTTSGIKLSWPGYNGYDEEKGGVTTYPPGTKENGGIFLHSNPWVIISETIAGRGEIAFEYYNQINPAAKNDIIDRYEVEPYCYAQNMLGDEHPQFGLGRNSWLSGTASWMYQAATQYILGVHPACDGLVIDPCIPSKWDSFRMKRKFRGAIYNIEVLNPGHVCKGVKSVEIDGKKHAGNTLPVLKAGTEHTVRVTMG